MFVLALLIGGAYFYFCNLAVANGMTYNNRFQIYIRFARIFTRI